VSHVFALATSVAQRESSMASNPLPKRLRKAVADRSSNPAGAFVCPESVVEAAIEGLAGCEGTALSQTVLHDLLGQVDLPPPVTPEELTVRFIERLVELRRMLSLDVEAAYAGDPAAKGFDEIVLAYPAIRALAIHRIAHELYGYGVPILPRIMSEHAHDRTGIDIHPGARIGQRFFIDHGTGIVVGETAVIGDRVRLYQGVTLGATSLRDSSALRGKKRHPTIEDDVTIYAGATILGGGTVIGAGSVIGGNVFLTKSVPAGSRVMAEPPRHLVKSSEAKEGGPANESSALTWDI
jgi:serine O-acetyltransferase